MGIGKRYCNDRYGDYFSFYQTLWRLWEMTERSLKEKEILFPGSYDNVKINESTKAFRLIDDQCSWVTINLTAPTILPLDISRGSHPCKNTSATTGAPVTAAWAREQEARPHAKNTTWNGEIVHQFSCQHLPQSSASLLECSMEYLVSKRLEKSSIVKLSLISDSRYIKS